MRSISLRMALGLVFAAGAQAKSPIYPVCADDRQDSVEYAACMTRTEYPRAPAPTATVNDAPRAAPQIAPAAADLGTPDAQARRTARAALARR